MSAIPTRPLDVREFVDAQRVSGFQWIVLALCFMVVALDGFDTAAMGFIAPALRADWHLDPAHLSPVLVAALCGLAVGAFVSGPIADRLGRKRVVMLSVGFFGLFSLASAASHSVASLTALRFLTGVGLGGAMPNAVTLMSEFCPARRRSVLVTTMFCGFTLGSALGGFIAARLVPDLGWQSVLVLGGVLPLIVVPFLALFLPESARYLLLRPGNEPRVARTLQRIAPLPQNWDGGFMLDADDGAGQGGNRPWKLIFSRPLRSGTLMLWGTFFMSLLIIYLLMNWLPTLIHGAGLSMAQAAWVTAMFQVGGTFGAVALGAAMDRLNGYRVLAVAYALGALCILGISQLHDDFTMLVLCVAGVGVCVSGSQVGANALAASFYPTAGRATGVSWALGAGRIGSILGSLFGGLLLEFGWGIEGIFALLMIPSVIAALLIFTMGRRFRDAEPITLDRPHTVG